jgi:hypothetical protein
MTALMPKTRVVPALAAPETQKIMRKFTRLKIRQVTFVQHGYTYNAWLVYGYAPDGARIRKQFQDRGEAQAWASTQEVRHANLDATQGPVLTRLDQDQLLNAELAISRLNGKGTLLEAVDHFLRTGRSVGARIALKEAIKKFLASKASEGVRARTVKQLKSVLTLFSAKFGENKFLYEVTSESCEEFLKSRGNSAKTWNNYRADLHNFFEHARSKAVGWVGANPVAEIEKRKADGRGMPCIVNLDQAQKLMAAVEAVDKGSLAPYFALALFAGIRTGPGGELQKLLSSDQRSAWVDISTGVIHIQPGVSKTREYRQIRIRPNLHTWLTIYPIGPLPKNFDRNLKAIRSKFGLGHDVLRHTFFSSHVGAFGSIAEAALEGGNSEQVCKRHYLNLMNKLEAVRFWQIAPKRVLKSRKAA